SCRHDGWDTSAKYLSKKVPQFYLLMEFEEVLKQVRETDLFKHITRWLLSGSSCMQNTILNGHDSLDKIAAEVCCQGAKLMCGKVVSCNAICSNTTQMKSLDCDDAESFTVVSSKVIVKDSACNAEMLVPRCQKKSGSLCDCGSNTSDTEHASVVDGLTVLILALPPDTWSCLKDAKLREEIIGIVSPTVCLICSNRR
ncbi:Glutathione gamma-glutamylcysteinyltransferase 1, partial [Bienertia sinuspersici]